MFSPKKESFSPRKEYPQDSNSAASSINSGMRFVRRVVVLVGIIVSLLAMFRGTLHADLMHRHEKLHSFPVNTVSLHQLAHHEDFSRGEILDSFRSISDRERRDPSPNRHHTSTPQQQHRLHNALSKKVEDQGQDSIPSSINTHQSHPANTALTPTASQPAASVQPHQSLPVLSSVNGDDENAAQTLADVNLTEPEVSSHPAEAEGVQASSSSLSGQEEGGEALDDGQDRAHRTAGHAREVAGGTTTHPASSSSSSHSSREVRESRGGPQGDKRRQHKKELSSLLSRWKEQGAEGKGPAVPQESHADAKVKERMRELEAHAEVRMQDHLKQEEEAEKRREKEQEDRRREQEEAEAARIKEKEAEEDKIKRELELKEVEAEAQSGDMSAVGKLNVMKARREKAESLAQAMHRTPVEGELGGGIAKSTGTATEGVKHLFDNLVDEEEEEEETQRMLKVEENLRRHEEKVLAEEREEREERERKKREDHLKWSQKEQDEANKAKRKQDAELKAKARREHQHQQHQQHQQQHDELHREKEPASSGLPTSTSSSTSTQGGYLFPKVTPTITVSTASSQQISDTSAVKPSKQDEEEVDEEEEDEVENEETQQGIREAVKIQREAEAMEREAAEREAAAGAKEGEEQFDLAEQGYSQWTRPVTDPEAAAILAKRKPHNGPNMHLRWPPEKEKTDPRPVHLRLHLRQFFEDGSFGVSMGHKGRPTSIDNRPHLDYLAQGQSGMLLERYTFHPAVLPFLPKEDAAWKFKTCAIVSNSGTLLEHSFGKEIDSRDAVFRINYPPIEGFEKHVGSKSTFEITNMHHVQLIADPQWRHPLLKRGTKTFRAPPDNPNGGTATLVLFESTVSQGWRFHMVPRLLHRYPSPKTVILSPDLVVAAEEVWREVYLSLASSADTCKAMARRADRLGDVKLSAEHLEVCKATSGWFTLVFASQICNEVHMYGFSGWRKHSKVKQAKYHYFDNVTGVTNVHSFDLSLRIYKEFGKYYKVFTHD